jgi:ABC-2 type transport system ATP-binding protein
MPDHFAMYKQMTVFEYLDFFAAAYGQSVQQRNTTVDDVLQLTDMSERADSLIKGLSRGMQQRVSLARVLVHDPKLLLLDEPASGLDPRARIELMEILRELASMGKTIFISSHILSELATLCDSVTIIDRGKIKYSGDMEQLLTQTEGDHAEFVIQTSTAVPDLAGAIGRVPGVSKVVVEEGDERELTIVFDPHQVTTGKVLEAAIHHGADVVMFQRNRRHLDEAFMDLTEPGVRS